MGVIPTTQSLQSLQSVPEVKALLIPVKDDPGRTGEVPVRHQRSRTCNSFSRIATLLSMDYLSILVICLQIHKTVAIAPVGVPPRI